jgi:hypothetical protein
VVVWLDGVGVRREVTRITLSRRGEEGVGVVLVPFRRGVECRLDVVHERQHCGRLPVCGKDTPTASKGKGDDRG